jgi:hypothetical protein
VKKAIFLGGPCDGKAMWVPDELWPRIHVPIDFDNPVFDPADEAPTAAPAYRVAWYERGPRLALSTPTVCTFYTFGGIQ